MIGKMRLRLKTAYESLSGVEKDGFMSDLIGLYTIDPFRRLTIVVIAFLFLMFIHQVRIALWFGGLYLVWVLLYFVTFLGVYFQFKDRKGKRVLRKTVFK